MSLARRRCTSARVGVVDDAAGGSLGFTFGGEGVGVRVGVGVGQRASESMM